MRIINIAFATSSMLSLHLIYALRGDLGALLGVIAIWSVLVSGTVLYVLLVLKRPYDLQDSQKLGDEMQSYVRKHHWLMLTVWLIVPGFWIGLVARSPLPIAVAILLTIEILAWIRRVLRSRLPKKHAVRKFAPRALLRNATAFLGATLLGASIRALVGY